MRLLSVCLFYANLKIRWLWYHLQVGYRHTMLILSLHWYSYNLQLSWISYGYRSDYRYGIVCFLLLLSLSSCSPFLFTWNLTSCHSLYLFLHSSILIILIISDQLCTLLYFHYNLFLGFSDEIFNSHLIFYRLIILFPYSTWLSYEPLSTSLSVVTKLFFYGVEDLEIYFLLEILIKLF